MPRAPQISQFSDSSIPFAVAASLCGPAAAIAFARVNGRDPTLKEVQALAEQVGWIQGKGMAGPASQRALLAKMGIEADLTPAADAGRIVADVQAGKPVIVSTGLHYFTLSDHDPATNRYYVGASGTDLKNGREWMSLDDIDRASRERGYGGISGALHMTGAPAGSATVPRERQQFLEANTPGESTVLTPPTRQDARGTPSTGGLAADLPSSTPPSPVPETTPQTMASAPASTTPVVDDRTMADLFARGLLEQLGSAAGTAPPTIYRLPGAELPGFRPSRFALPMGVG